MNDSGMCTALMDATTGTQQWRCTISSGNCELATPLASTPLLIGS